MRLDIWARLGSLAGSEKNAFKLGSTATLRLTADVAKNLSVLSGVACRKRRAIFSYLAAPN